MDSPFDFISTSNGSSVGEAARDAALNEDYPQEQQTTARLDMLPGPGRGNRSITPLAFYQHLLPRRLKPLHRLRRNVSKIRADVEAIAFVLASLQGRTS